MDVEIEIEGGKIDGNEEFCQHGQRLCLEPVPVTVTVTVTVTITAADRLKPVKRDPRIFLPFPPFLPFLLFCPLHYEYPLPL